jgi:hypothetical protein
VKSTKNGEVMNLYTLEVFITSGPVTEKFVKQNPVISRTIEIRGDQTLEELHHAIFDAFDREDEHMYEFQFGGKGPNDPDARSYGLSIALQDGGEQSNGDVRQVTLDAVGLKNEGIFGYWFDFGDDWWHQVNVVSIEQKAAVGDYPRVIERTGESPPQYADFDE